METSGHWDWYRETCSRRNRPATRPRTSAGCAEADELSRPRADLQAWPEELSRPAATVGRIRRGASLRAVGRDAWFDACAASPRTTRMCSAPGPARRRCLKINDLILSTYADFGFEGDLTVKLSTRPDARRHRRDVDHAERVMATVLSRSRKATTTASRPRSIPAKARSTDRSSNTLRDAIGATGKRHHAGRLQPAGKIRRVLHRCRRLEEVPVMVHRAICGSMERLSAS